MSERQERGKWGEFIDPPMIPDTAREVSTTQPDEPSEEKETFFPNANHIVITPKSRDEAGLYIDDGYGSKEGVYGMSPSDSEWD